MRTINSETISLRQWIKDASGAIGKSDNTTDAVSSVYMSASLKIAMSLTEQISRAEKLADLGVNTEIEMLPNMSVNDWADFVWVCLNTSKTHNSEHISPWQRDKCPQDIGGEDYQPLPARRENEYKRTIDDHLKIFLESLDADEFDEAEAAPQRRGDAFASSPLTYASHAETICFTSSSSEAENGTCLNVDSACIRFPESHRTNIFNSVANTSKDKLHRIYSAGLVFYELFSGGELPPRGLLSLASSERAFVSLPTLTLTERDNDGEVSKSDSKRRREGPYGSTDGVGLCQLSFEYLKLIGLPGPLCTLIFNMLDCVYGDFSGNDCYTRMGDVSSDLHLMIDKPHKFLRDLDMEKLSLSGLELNDTVFSREDEFTLIKSCYHRSVTESCELAIVTGESGTGKSWLAHRVGQFIFSQGGVFLTGKFDQMKQVAPFSALASAFDQYCDVLMREKESYWAKGIVEKLNAALGRDSHHLIKVIPKLNLILPRNTGIVDSSSSENCVNAVQRLHYLLCRFVDVISTFSVVSVTLFLDDLQWADVASISVLNQLLLKRYKRFFFLGCCRKDAMENDVPFSDMIENVSALGIKTTVVKLNCMDRDTLSQMMSNLLCLPPRIIRSLSDIIYTKTKGNPLFFSQLMISLNRDGLLRLSLSRQRWVWDEEEIQSMKLPDDVALCFANGISKLPLEVQSALRILSMFGASVKCEYFEALESHLNVKLIEPLKIAITEGLVSSLRGSFHFCHDRIQEASYIMIEERDRCRDHLMFGLCLIKLALDTGDNEVMFTAVNQINFCGPAPFLDAQECANMAKYNLMAGKSAMGMSHFLSAYSFFSCGIGFLPHGHWVDHYELSLELFELSSKTALVTGNIQNLHVLADEVLRHARSFRDKLNIYFTIISSLAYASKNSKALEQGHKILSRLGEAIPSNPTQEALEQHIQQTQSLIRGVSENDILNCRLMTDNIKLAAMRFLAQLESVTIMVEPALHPFVTLKMVQLTISYGLSPASPIGFVYFGSLLAKRGNIRVGLRFTSLAKTLLDKLEARESAGEVICIATEMLCFVEPVQSSRELLLIQGESAAMAGGDIHWACINRLQYCSMMFWTYSDLSVVDDKFSEACRFMRENQHRTSLFFILMMQKTISSMKGSEPETSELSRNIHESNNPRHLMILSFHNLYISFMLDNDGMLKEYAETFFELNRSSWFLHFGDAGQALILGLVSFQFYRETQDSVWLDRGKKYSSDMKLWATQGSMWNFQHKQLLLEAEEHYSNGRFEDAQLSYKNAIAFARSRKFVNDEALACEVAAKFYWGTGSLVSSLEHFRLAHEKYIQWGALAKADKLFASINQKFSNVLDDNSALLSGILNKSGVANSQSSDGTGPPKRRMA